MKINEEKIIAALENPRAAEALNLVIATVTAGLVARRAVRKGLIAFGVNEKAAKRTPALLGGAAFIIAANAHSALRLANRTATFQDADKPLHGDNSPLSSVR